MSPRTALFPGSFDPITLGHLDLIQRSLVHFDRMVVAVGHNSDKKYLFDLTTRLRWLQELLAGDSRIQVLTYEDLTARFCQEIGASFIVRGLRNTLDFESEKSIAQLNRDLFGVETFFFGLRPRIAGGFFLRSSRYRIARWQPCSLGTRRCCQRYFGPQIRPKPLRYSGPAPCSRLRTDG
jgi:pantetheine-phosphate adenylyltransferase